MNNLLYLYLVEAERRRDRLAEAAHDRLVKQLKRLAYFLWLSSVLLF